MHRTRDCSLHHRFHLVTLAAVVTVFITADCSSSTEQEKNSDKDGGIDASTAEQNRGARIYATMAATHKVIVIDERSQTIIDSIAIGKGPAILLSTPDQKKLYSANWEDFTVSSIDVEASAASQITMPGRPYVIAMAPDGEHVYVGCASTPPEVSVIRTDTDTIDNHLEMSELPASIIVSPDGEILYIAMLHLSSDGPGTLQANSSTTGETVREPLTVGTSPAWITITPDGSKVYTLNFLSDDISVVDTESWTVEATIDTGSGSRGIIGAVTPDGSSLYVTNHGSGNFVEIDTATNRITKTIDVNGRPVGVCFNREGSRVYVTDLGPESLQGAADLNYLLTGVFTLPGNGQVSIFDTTSGERIGSEIGVDPGATSVVVIEPG